MNRREGPAGPSPVEGPPRCRHVTRKPKLAALEIGKLPRLAVVELDLLLLHEESDPARFERLKQKIASEGRLRNPPIAARDEKSGAYVLLDGANRIGALRELGARFVVVQEIDMSDANLTVSTWHHAVEGLDVREALGRAESFAKIVSTVGVFTCDDDFLPSFRRGWACLIVLPDRTTYAVQGGTDSSRRAALARDVFRLTSDRADVDRVTYTNMRDLARHYPRFSALVCYRPFSKQDVAKFAKDRTLLPGGITRFCVPKRALEFSVPLDFLIEDGPAETKRATIDRMIQEKIAARRIRFYAEPTFYFDE